MALIKSVSHLVFELHESILELFDQDITHLGDSLEAMSEYFLGVACWLRDLESDVHNWLAGMGYRVSAEFNLVIFDYYISQQISKSVIFI